MCLPISAWKFSRAMHEAGARWSRIQVSQPWSNIGMTQVSKILKAESGFNDPWNAPTFPSKEVVLALAMFSLTDSLAERSLRKVLSSVHTVFPQNDLRGRSFYCIDHSDQSFWQLHTVIKWDDHTLSSRQHFPSTPEWSTGLESQKLSLCHMGKGTVYCHLLCD